MSERLKCIIKTVFPEFFFYKLLTNFKTLRSLKARRIFERAPETPVWLERDILESLQQKYAFRPEYGYDPHSVEQRGKKRAEQILLLIRKDAEKIKTFLELGCWDGMVSCSLQRMGKVATAIDIRSEGLDKRAIHEGVTFMQMDAAHLEFEDGSFDFVFSYDGFEHFADPELVLQESMRVVKEGGYIYLVFGPLYMSPWGLHAYKSITVPYCQFLFAKELLIDFTNTRKLEPIDFAQVNCKSLEDYRKMWKRYSHTLKSIRYYEMYNTSHVDLIIEYPSCFRSKAKCFDNLIVSSIEVLFRKIR